MVMGKLINLTVFLFHLILPVSISPVAALKFLGNKKAKYERLNL